LIRRHRSEGRNVLILDAGNLFFRVLPKNRLERKEFLQKADLMIQAYNVMGYDGLNIGELDLIMGHEFLVQTAGKATFPFLSSNLFNKNGDSPLFPTHMVKEMSRMRMGVFGLIDPRMVGTMDSMTVSDPVEEAQRAVSHLKKECDFIIALSQLGEKEDRKLALAVPEIDLIIGGMKSKTVRYTNISDTIMVRLIPRGGYLGVLELDIKEEGRPYRFSDLNHRDEMRARIERIRFQSNLIEDQLHELSPKEKNRKLRKLEVLRTAEKELQTRIASYATKNTFNNQVLPINIRIEDDPLITQLLQENE
jgi:2',3'-cyclic-nucleotide 2'-phosphodiesterase (5'-nucleotidase family)